MDATTIVVVIAVAVILAVVVVALVLRGRAKPISASSGVSVPRAGRASSSLGASLRQVLGSGGVSEQTWAELEEAMLAADVGVEASSAIVRGVRSARPENADQAREQLARQLRLELGDKQRELQLGGSPSVILVVGVNGTGKTTTIAKLAARFGGEGKKVVLAEMSKIHRVAAGTRGVVDEVLLVLDATAGQNGITQVREFSDAVPVSGIVLTKLDGTAKGGIVIAVERQLGVPVKLVGVGEGIDDLLPFDPDRFVDELLEG